MNQTPEDRQRIVREILGPVDVYDKAPGPNGPWTYRSLSIKRQQNTIIVRDVDMKPADQFSVSELNDKREDDNAYDVLATRLDRLHKESLKAL